MISGPNPIEKTSTRTPQPADPRDDVVAQLVDEHENGQNDQKRDNRAGDIGYKFHHSTT
jgi:hypothetical protein